MGKYVRRVYLSFSLFLASANSSLAQSQEAQQLLLNWEKLSQLKEILNNMYKGYEIVSMGYTTIKNISEGNFNLHQLFLDGLLNVSPPVRKYRRIVDIIRYQKLIIKESRDAVKLFKQSDHFTATEINYINSVHQQLMRMSKGNLGELLMVITARRLRMSDDERLRAIDNIFQSVAEQLSVLRQFNSSTLALTKQRYFDRQQIEIARRLHGIR